MHPGHIARAALLPDSGMTWDVGLTASCRAGQHERSDTLSSTYYIRRINCLAIINLIYFATECIRNDCLVAVRHEIQALLALILCINTRYR